MTHSERDRIAKMKVTVSILVLILAVCEGQRYPRYYVTYSSQNLDRNDGRYVHDDSGRYIPDNRGKYYHIHNPYLHQVGQDWQEQESKINNDFVVPDVPKRYGTYDDSRIKIIRLESDVQNKGFQYGYETENEIFGEETAKLHNVGTNKESINTEGFYKYTGPDNVIYETNFTAGEDGYIPQGDHLPLAIRRALAYIMKNNKKNTEGNTRNK